MKQAKIPTEYLSNDISDLKRAALVNKDLDLLRALDKSIKRSKGWRVLYARLDESLVRDETGALVPIESIGVSRYDMPFHFCSIAFAPGLKNPALGWPEGHLYFSLTLSQEERMSKLIIYELPPATEFPLPDSFGWDVWIEVANNYLKATDQVFRNWNEWSDWIRRYPAGRFFPKPDSMRIYQYKDNFGNTILTNSPPKDGRPYTIE